MSLDLPVVGTNFSALDQSTLSLNIIKIPLYPPLSELFDFLVVDNNEHNLALINYYFFLSIYLSLNNSHKPYFVLIGKDVN